MNTINLNDTMGQINKDHAIVMDFLYKHVAPEQMIDEIEDVNLKTICQGIKKWYAESGEYWCDNATRIIHNSVWLTAIRAAIEKFNKNTFKTDDEWSVILNGEF